jgi:hypothetical protein
VVLAVAEAVVAVVTIMEEVMIVDTVAAAMEETVIATTATVADTEAEEMVAGKAMVEATVEVVIMEVMDRQPHTMVPQLP